MASIWGVLGDDSHASNTENIATSPDDKHSFHYRKSPTKPPLAGANMVDKVMDRLVATALPSVVSQDVLDQRLERQNSRPPFSVALMSKNFRKFTARVGIVFEAYYFIQEVLFWKHPSVTLSMISIYSFICLNPGLLLVAPLIYLLFGIMVPAYVARHPPELSNLQSYPVPSQGPPLRDPQKPQPVPDVSREFYLNIVDTQNSLLDYATAYDMVQSLLGDFAYFDGDESRSSLVYLVLVCSTTVLLLLSSTIYYIVPWRLVFLVSGWIILGLTYPLSYITDSRPFEQLNYKYTNMLGKLDTYASGEFEIKEPHEQRQVEVYELQAFDVEFGEWKKSIFFPDAHAPSVSRSFAPSPKGAATINEVHPPKQWTFVTDNWQLDYSPSEWVASLGLGEVTDIDQDEKWVYDRCNKAYQWRRRRWIRICSRH